MGRIAIVTDSTTGIPEDVAKELEIPVIPLNVHWGDEDYKDGVTLDAKTFYRWLQEREDFPKTSQPSAGEFITFYEDVAERLNTDTILGIYLSSELSGTVSSAKLAQQSMSKFRIEVFDSKFISLPTNFMVIEAAQMARAGATIDDILDRMRAMQQVMHIIFAVDTLEYLHRGGRIGGAARLLGTALSLKPLLELHNGRVESLEKVRRRSKSLQRLIAVAEERLQGQQPTQLGLLHTGLDADVEFVSTMVKERLNPKAFTLGLLTPVVGTHAGPGTIGLAFHTA